MTVASNATGRAWTACALLRAWMARSEVSGAGTAASAGTAQPTMIATIGISLLIVIRPFNGNGAHLSLTTFIGRVPPANHFVVKNRVKCGWIGAGPKSS